MTQKNANIYIIGAGVSGLVAATILENEGYSPVVFEATDRVGGRVKTDVVEGYQLDHGFQVLLTAYPGAQKYLDYKALELQRFLPGASIFKNGKQKVIGDPLRDFSLLFSTVFSGIGTLSDKTKVLKLNTRLKAKSISEIFSDKEKTTLSYLQGLGFSSDMINSFFKPFFSGIFLESELKTSSRMFEFVYKMFGEGHAALPSAGIEAIPKQLSGKLKNTKFRFKTKVESVKEGEIILTNGQHFESDFTIVATDAKNLLEGEEITKTNWKSCETFYFETDKKVIEKPLIGLIPESSSLINNIFYHTSLKTAVRAKKELLSVTVVDDKGLTNAELIQRVEKELKELCGINVGRLLKHYSIPYALPDLSDIKYEKSPEDTKIGKGIFLAGDTQLNGSLNAAMLSGESAALGVLSELNKTTTNG